MSCFSFRRSQPVSVQTKYALGIISQTMDIDVCKWKACMSIYRVVIYFKLTLQFIFYLFLILEKHFDDPQSGSGYLAWRIKKVQRNTAAQSRSYSVALQLSPGAAAQQIVQKERGRFSALISSCLVSTVMKQYPFWNIQLMNQQSKRRWGPHFSTVKNWFKISSALWQSLMSSHNSSTSLAW